MKIPKKLKIAGFNYKITHNKQVADHSSTFASTINAQQEINVGLGFPIQKQEQTFLHEILHAVWFCYGLKEAGFKNEQEEHIVDALSNGLYQVLKDNKLIK